MDIKNLFIKIGVTVLTILLLLSSLIGVTAKATRVELSSSPASAHTIFVEFATSTW